MPNPNSLVDWPWWLDSDTLALAQTVISSFALVAALWVAKRQFTLMADQDVLINAQRSLLQENVNIESRLEAMTKAQGDIMQKQHEIAAEELAIIVNNLSRRANLAMRILETNWAERQFLFGAENQGTKAAMGFYWQILIPWHGVTATARSSDVYTDDLLVRGDRYRSYSAYVPKPIYPGKIAACMAVTVDDAFWRSALDEPNRPVYLWRLICDDGSFPEGEGWDFEYVNPPDRGFPELKPHQMQY